MPDVSQLKAGDEIEAVFRDVEWEYDDFFEPEDTGKRTTVRGVLFVRPTASGDPLYLDTDYRCVRDSSGVNAGSWLESFKLLKKGDS